MAPTEPSTDLPALLPPVVYRLRGSQAEMGRQLGELSATDGGYEFKQPELAGALANLLD